MKIKFFHIASAFIAMVILSAALPVSDAAQSIAAQSLLASHPQISSAVPQVMPPHPRLWDSIAQGKTTLPQHMTNPALAQSLGIDSAGSRRTPRIGTIRALAILVDFSDNVHTATASFFDSLIFAAPVAGRGSVRDYYSEVSYGQVDIITVNLPSSLGWQQAPSTYASYVNSNYCTGDSYPNNCQKLAEDMVDAVNGVVNFADYDNDGDGNAESIMLIHAGPGAEFSGNTSDIWSHSWSLHTARHYDGVTISNYVIMPEYWQTVNATSSDMTIGVFAHEMGHGFWGLPDLYDRDNSSQGIGQWSLMAGGSWNGPNSDGSSPAWPDAWSRVQMGFVTSTDISSNATAHHIPQVYNNPAPSLTVLRLRSSVLASQEYFLIENRQQVSDSYDEDLSGGGLLIWHIDEAMNAQQNDNECTAQHHWQCNTQHYLVALEQADGQLHLEKRNNQGDAGDPFPGTSNNRNWSMTTNPESSSWYTSADSCIGVTNISDSGDNMTANLQIACVTLPNQPSDLIATPVSQTEIDLSWKDNSDNEDGFKIERNGIVIATVEANVTNYSDTGLTCDTFHSYRVRAYNIAGESNSNTASALTFLCTPTNLVATRASQTQINLKWDDTNNHEDGTKIERSLDGISGWTQRGTVGPNVTTYSDTGLTCDTTYYYRVRAFKTGDDSPPSNVANDTTVLCTPANLQAVAVSRTQINLTWQDTNRDEDGTKIERSEDGGSTWKEIARVGQNVESYSDKGLTCNTYYYRVRAYNARGDSPYSNPASATTFVCRYVAPGGTDYGNLCTNKASPCATVQYAVDVAGAVNGREDEVRIAAGTYTGVNIRPRNDVSASGNVIQMVYLIKTVILRGGYSTSNWLVSNPAANPTTVDAQKQGRVVYVTGNVAPTIEGLRLTGGEAARLRGGAGYDAGGGVYAINAALVMSVCQVYGNRADYGGGLYLANSPATLLGNMILTNTAASGGGVYLTASPAALVGNTLRANTATYAGGAYLINSAATFSGNTVAGNTAQDGGGLLLTRSNATLAGNLIQGNTASTGSGLYINDHSDAALTNNVVTDNQANTNGTVVYVSGSNPRLLHTTLARNNGTGLYVTVYPAWGTYTSTVTLVNTIIAGHPLGMQVTPGNLVTANGVLWSGNGTNVIGAATITNAFTGDPAFAADGYHLTSGSAAVDKGVNADVTTDIDGQARPQYAGYDLGADEYLVPVPPTSITINGPAAGIGNTSYTFDAAVTPGLATTPIVYVWQATGQSAVTHIGGVNDAVTFAWPSGTTGSQLVTVTATGAGVTVADTHVIVLGNQAAARLYLDPSALSRNVGDIFTLDIKADTGSNNMDTVDAYLSFDPALLEVVDASGTLTNVIEINPALMVSVTMNAVNNTTGQVDLSVSKFDGPLSGMFSIATILFRVKASAPATEIAFVRSGARQSDLLLAGTSLNPNLSSSFVSTAASVSLTGRVVLERRGPAGTSRWVTPLYRISNSGSIIAGVRVYEAGTPNLLDVYTATTDMNGEFNLPLTGLSAGLYDVEVKGANTLSVRKLDVSLPGPLVDFGTLLVGDNNGDDRVNGGDISYQVPSFTKCSGDPAFRPYADTNNDDCVNGADVSGLIPNFIKAGPITVTGASANRIAIPDRQVFPSISRPQDAASLSLSPSSWSVRVNDIFTFTIVAGAGIRNADTVDAYLNFDPTLLEAVNADGSPASTIDLNTAVFGSATINAVNNTTGQIDFSASKFTPPPFSGTFTAASLRFRAKASANLTSIQFVRQGGRQSDVLYAGESLDPALASAAIVGVDAHTLYLPLVLRNYESVRADFDASPTSGPPPLTVVFVNTSRGNPTASLWDFGDNVTSTLQDPVHVYTQTGVYTVSLTVSKPTGLVALPGDSDTLTRANYITVYTSTPPNCAELVVNGGFESDGNWDIPATAYSAIYTTTVAHSGNHSLRAGIIDPADNVYSFSDAWQTVTIPRNAQSAVLRFWLYPAMTQTSGDSDYQRALILDQLGNTMQTLVVQQSDARAWTPYEFELRDHAGETVRLYFDAFNNGHWGVTAMYVDDVSLQVCPAQ